MRYTSCAGPAGVRPPWGGRVARPAPRPVVRYPEPSVTSRRLAFSDNWRRAMAGPQAFA